MNNIEVFSTILFDFISPFSYQLGEIIHLG
jgi:hypothetical protein